MKTLFYAGKALEGTGLLVVLSGLVMSIQLGFQEEGLASMKYESVALGLGGALFVVGWLLERRAAGG